jgi:uncharacterized protein (TIGR00297 family)
MILALLICLACSSLAAVAAWRMHALALSGSVAATVVGTIVLAAGGVQWAVLMLVFFATSSALSRLESNPSGYVAREGPRDAIQVLANGGVPALAAALYLAWPHHLLLVAYAGALAAATSDTWASEIGSRFGGVPRSVRTGRRVRAGTSGAITTIGSIASLAGAALIGLCGRPLLGLTAADLVAVVAGGVAGSAIDTVLGASLQQVRQCPTCGALTEQRVHTPCGTRTDRVRGSRWLDNDGVNALACACGALAAGALAQLLSTL